MQHCRGFNSGAGQEQSRQRGLCTDISYHRAYLEDLSTKTAFQQLRQGQMARGHSLTSHGLVGVQRGDVHKIVVPKSLWQQILKQCPDVPIVVHVGMRKTMELVDQQFHWHSIRGDTI